MRKVILTAAIFSLALLTTQAVAFVHLVYEEEPSEHDSDNCSVCQQLFTLANNLIVEEPAEILQSSYCQWGPDFKTNPIPVVFTFQTSEPRAPPVIS